MCYLLTIGTREREARLDTLLRRESTLTARGYEAPFRVGPSRNASMKTLFPAGDRPFDVVRGQCSCEFMPSKRKEAGPHEALCRWLRDLARAEGGVRVFVHWYSGRFDTEPVRNAGTIRITVDQLVDASVLGEDRVVNIVSPDSPLRHA